MDIKKAALGIASRILRFAGIILVIYVSMVFYLALTERRNAYPRAITHIEAEEAIKNTAKAISCTLEDGTVLGGWSLGEPQKPVLLYYPDADEDAAQFLAEVLSLEFANMVTFNYRGSANNKGTPSAETFGADAQSIAECAAQINGKAPQFLAGRGTGAILAANQLSNGQHLVLIDPVFSIADAIADKYRLLYPKFLVRAKDSISVASLKSKLNQVTLLTDRKKFCDRNHTAIERLPGIVVENRENSSLKNTLTKILQFKTEKTGPQQPSGISDN